MPNRFAWLFTLRVKLGLVTTVAVLLLLALYYWLLSSFVVSKLAALDIEEAKRDLQRVYMSGQAQENYLEAMCHQLSANDAMYAFTQTRDPALVDRILTDDLFRVGDLSLVYVCLNDGTALWQRAYDSIAKRGLALAEFPPDRLPPDHVLLVPEDGANTAWDGFFLTSAGPMQVSAKPILTAAGEGPVHGTVIVGRLADAVRIARMKQQTQVDFTLGPPPSDRGLGMGIWMHALMIQGPVAYRKDDATVAAMGPVTDVRGTPILALEVLTPRRIAPGARQVMITSIAFTVCAALAIIAALVGFIHILAEIPLKRLAGHMRRIQQTTEPEHFPYTYGGEIGHMAEAFNGMLERLREAQHALRDSESRFRSLNESAMDAIVSADAGARIASWNKGAERMFGYPAEGMIGRPLSLLLPERSLLDGPGLIVRIEEHIALGPGRPLEFTARRADGAEMPVEMSVGAWETRDGRYYAGILRDITRRRSSEAALAQAKEAAEAANKAKSQFLASMSHEIRTPMNGVVGMTELLSSTDLGPQQRRYVEGIRESADSLLEIINDILDLSKIEADKVELERVPFNPSDLVQQIVWSLRPSARKKGLELRCTAAPGVPAHFAGDPVRLRQVLVNLVGNAIKFTEKGHCEVIVEIDPAPPGGLPEGALALRFGVLDTGIGVAPHLREAIFERFAQADASIARRYGGTGLGLAICKRIVELMHGRIWVESEPGQGSRFYFSVPLAPCGAPAETESAESAIDLEAPLPRLDVLVAEDTKMNQDLFTLFLEGQGHRVAIVESGHDVVERLRRERFDVVLMDVEMPGMDGVQATRIVRDPENGALDPDVPIVAVTAHALIGDRERFIEAGMNDYVSKPIDFRELRAAIFRAAAGRPARPGGDAPPAAPVRNGALSARDEALARLGGNEAALARMDGIFLEDAPALVDRFEQAVRDGRADDARRAAHSLKSMAATIGAAGLSAAARDLEARAQAGAWEALRSELPRLRAAADAVLAVLRAEGHVP